MFIMARRNTAYQPRRSPPQTDLDRVQDTSDTMRSATREELRTNYTQPESVSPPFRGRTDPAYITWLELASIWKIIKVIGGVIFTVAPLIWYASRLDNNVDNLQQDVKEVKDKTQNLIESNIKQDVKLDSLELSVTNVKAQVDLKMQKDSHNRMPNK
jgi:hypothetical protein